MVTTEIAILPLHAGTKIGDPSDRSAESLKLSFDTLLDRDGCRNVHFGPHVESPDNVQLMIDWDSVQKHYDFMAAAEYGPMMKRLGGIMSGEANIVHVDFQPDGALTRALSAPVTEIATFYFDGAAPQGYADGARKAAEWLEKEAEGFLGLAMGFTHEEVEHEGAKAKCAVWALGWNSVQAHMDFRQTQGFKDNIHLLRNGSKGVEMHHVVMMPVVGSDPVSTGSAALNRRAI